MERDAAFFGGTASPPPAFPSLTDGILRRGADGRIQSPAGLLGPHGRVRLQGREGRFDDIVGLRFVLVTRSAAALAGLGETQRAHLDALAVRRVVIKAVGDANTADALVGLDAKFIPYMQQHVIDTMLVRPDFYLYGAVEEASQINRLIDDLAHDLERHGVRLDPRCATQPLAA